MREVPFAETASRPGTWLVLLYQVPSRSSSVRVRIWRRLQGAGAIQLRQAAYVLPHRDAQREDLEWLKSEIVGLGGQATVFSADAVDAFTHDEIVEMFRAARARDVTALSRRAERLLRQLARAAAGGPLPAQSPHGRVVRSLLESWRALLAVMFFDTPGSPELEALMQKIATYSAGRVPRPAGRLESLDRNVYAHRRWVTRPRPGVDRMASAWLIRKFIDPYARFEFSDRPHPEAVAFDMFGVEFGHQGDACTFEVLASRFGIDEPAVQRIARIVHDLDLRDARFGEPETPGVGAIVDGLRHAHPDDPELLERGIAMFESLARGAPEGSSGAPRDRPRRPAPAARSRRPTAAARTSPGKSR